MFRKNAPFDAYTQYRISILTIKIPRNLRCEKLINDHTSFIKNYNHVLLYFTGFLSSYAKYSKLINKIKLSF